MAAATSAAPAPPIISGATGEIPGPTWHTSTGRHPGGASGAGSVTADDGLTVAVAVAVVAGLGTSGVGAGLSRRAPLAPPRARPMGAKSNMVQRSSALLRRTLHPPGVSCRHACRERIEPPRGTRHLRARSAGQPAAKAPGLLVVEHNARA